MGRRKGSKNKTTLALREAILKALDNLGGYRYLEELGLKNSSAFVTLLAKLLPTNLGMEEGSVPGAVVLPATITNIEAFYDVVKSEHPEFFANGTGQRGAFYLPEPASSREEWVRQQEGNPDLKPV